MSFLEFSLYFFICNAVYDIIYNIIRNYYMEKQFKKIREKLESGEVTVWN